jgi:hypothetical protein
MTGAIIAIGIVLICIGGVTMSVVSYFRLQRHRADAVAMAGYRALAEQAADRERGLQDQLGELTVRLTAVEQLLRSVE